MESLEKPNANRAIREKANRMLNSRKLSGLLVTQKIWACNLSRQGPPTDHTGITCMNKGVQQRLGSSWYKSRERAEVAMAPIQQWT